jgi:hypothetical protein
MSENLRAQVNDFSFTFFSDAFPEMIEVTEVERGFVLKIYFPAEILPVGILNPMCQSTFITAPVNLFQ